MDCIHVNFQKDQKTLTTVIKMYYEANRGGNYFLSSDKLGEIIRYQLSIVIIYLALIG